MVETAWGKLGGVLRWELKRRGLWSGSPTYLGIAGWTSWEEPGGRLDGFEGGPLAELTDECYEFIFVDRLSALKAQLAVKSNIEGLVLCNVGHFLLERQKQHDPIGFRVFETLQKVVREGIARGELVVLAGDARVRNDTVIGFEPTAGPDPPARDLSGLVARWNDDLLHELVTARREPQGQVFARLRAHLQDLARQGIVAFRFREVCDPLKNDTRVRWTALLEETGGGSGGRRHRGLGEGGETVLAVTPEFPMESKDRFLDLVERVAAAIEILETDRRTRQYLAVLWKYLGSQANAEMLEDEEWWIHLSYRKLSQKLDIPRERMAELFSTLRKLVAVRRRGW